MGFPGGAMVKKLPANAGDMGLIPGSERSSGVGNGNPFQCSCLENPLDRRIWWAKSMGLQKVGHERVTEQACNHLFILLRWVLVAARGFFSFVADGDCSLVVTHGFLAAAASLLWSTGSRACRLQ